MRRVLLAMLILGSVGGFAAVTTEPPAPFETDAWPIPANAVDTHVLATLRQHGLELALPCADAVFLRRVYLDVLGVLPEPEAVTAFLADDQPDKRLRLIADLLQREEFADYWTMKWCDLLRVKAEFPSNLWPNAVQAYHRWLREAVRTNRPYDQFARELLTASGSNVRVPAANFYRAVQSREATGLAEAVALTFMGTRLAAWPKDRRDGLAAFFSRVAYKGTDEWKEEIVFCNPAAAGPLEAVYPDGARVIIPAGEDPRRVFAAWLTAPGNPWFARAMANRLWAWLLGRGIVHEPDDLRPDNPPSNPELLTCLEQELVASGYDLKRVLRLVLTSRTYQQSPIPRGDPVRAEALFGCYPVRRLDAEVLMDALNRIGGPGETYESPIPEPFTWIPEEQRVVALADGSITSTFLQRFGRPPRDTGLDSERGRGTTDAQRLYLLNSNDIQKRLKGSTGLRRVAHEAGGDRPRQIQGIYRFLLTRDPTPAEVTAAEAYWAIPGITADQAAIDLAWALLNSMEFLYRH